MKYRVKVRYYEFDFNDLFEACDFSVKAKNSYVPDDEDERVSVSIEFIDEEDESKDGRED